MKRIAGSAFVIGALVTLIAVGACTLLDDELPDDSCATDEDCFRAQGERCNQSTKRCELIDAGIDAP